ERAGFTVDIPRPGLCCGRPLYEFGMLDRAVRLLRENLIAMRPWLEAGVPVIVLEPSCLAVFRDELVSLLPEDEDALRLSRSALTLAEFLARAAPEGLQPEAERTALLHGHCHEKAIVGMNEQLAVLESAAVRTTLLDSGCCGMAGAFGYARENFDVSMAIGERVLLPAVREADPATLIIADGFSCRTQIGQATGRRAYHLAEVLHEGGSRVRSP